jgi:hypothetical protein
MVQLLPDTIVPISEIYILQKPIIARLLIKRIFFNCIPLLLCLCVHSHKLVFRHFLSIPKLDLSSLSVVQT